MRIQMHEPITIDEPMVLVPAGEYAVLLREAGYRSTPKLDRAIVQARRNFRKGRSIAWGKVKNDLV